MSDDESNIEDLTPTNPTIVVPAESVLLYDEIIVTPETDFHTLPLKTRLTKHFTYGEMIASQTAARHDIDNTPDFQTFKAGVEFAQTLLEPLRAEFGPVYPSSWLRVLALNAILPGTSKTSAHMYAVALDHTTQASLYDEMAWWINSDLPFDQVIYEYGRWIHIGGPKPGHEPRRQALMKFAGTPYLTYDPNQIDATGTKLVT